ncbi:MULTISPECIES: D-alanine--D-alanine ligase [Bacillaceae]|uniref:D-alanine--D-alanine ligase n=1 Tax=Gottfriedia acidiceleris TaxID=371036 RepID=A0ABY4JSD2_9BACI|nr:MULTISPECIES: D-alanine--D-alanine ligase [Bacillaceae]UPM56392.1 D-alanine--D-alanine ligase [Gottfriedia acidiceleris]
MMKIKLGLLYGGKSAEHKVSLQTAFAVISALDHTKFDVYPIYITEQGEWLQGKQIEGKVESVAALKFSNEDQHVNEIAPVALTSSIIPAASNQDSTGPVDVIFPLLHGPNGEDGTVQGLLELLNIPYVGNGVLASAAGMDKVIMKNLFAQAGIPQAKYVHFLKTEWKSNAESCYEVVEKELGYPVFVKPANLGSSVGITKAKNREALMASFEEAFQFDRKIIIEENIVGREIEIAVLGNDQVECSVVGEIKPSVEFYDYTAKYESGDTGLIIPAPVETETYEKIKHYAEVAFKAIDGSGLTRADFFVTEDGGVLMNEVNTMPGFTPFSMYPQLWQATGLTYPKLIEKLIDLAIERYEQKQQIKYNI